MGSGDSVRHGWNVWKEHMQNHRAQPRMDAPSETPFHARILLHPNETNKHAPALISPLCQHAYQLDDVFVVQSAVDGDLTRHLEVVQL